MKRLVLIGMFLISTVLADTKPNLEKYRLIVTAIDPDFHCIALSNNMVFYIPQKKWKTETFPEVGAVVYIEPALRVRDTRLSAVKDGEFLIKFSADPKKKPVTVWMCQDAEQQYLSYVSCQSVCTQPVGWFSSAVYQTALTLSDGSQWVLQNEAENKFKPGDRIIISQQKENDYLLMDVDEDLKASKEVLTWYRTIRVKPYLPGEATKK